MNGRHIGLLQLQTYLVLFALHALSVKYLEQMLSGSLS